MKIHTNLKSKDVMETHNLTIDKNLHEQTQNYKTIYFYFIE